MAWIESHQELARHPKTKKLARLLGVSLPAAVGHLHFLWWWAMDYAQDGDLSRYDAYDIADACGWEGDPEKILSALIESGFIDQTEEGLFIHDWDDYAGRLIEKRKANTERKRKSRERHAAVTRDTRDSHRATKPNQTIPNQIDGLIDNAPAHEKPETFEQAHKRIFGLACHPHNSEILRSYLDDGMEEAVIIRAMERAAEKGKTGFNFSFIRAIVENYFRNGVLTLEQAIKLDEAHDAARRRDPPGGKSRQVSQIELLNQLAKEFEERDTS